MPIPDLEHVWHVRKPGHEVWVWYLLQVRSPLQETYVAASAAARLAPGPRCTFGNDPAQVATGLGSLDARFAPQVPTVVTRFVFERCGG